MSFTQEELMMRGVVSTLPEEEQETVKILETRFFHLIETEGDLGLMAASLALMVLARKYS